MNYTENEDTIFFGKASLSFDLRHYWSSVKYTKFFRLITDGRLDKDDSFHDNPNINFNYLTIDLAYKWIFAPVSELSVVWKNSIFTDSEQIEKDYFNNLSDTFK